MAQQLEYNGVIIQDFFNYGRNTKKHLPICASTSRIFSILLGSISGEVTLFSTAKTTPSFVWIPIAVDPS